MHFLRRVIAFLLIISLLWFLGGVPVPSPTWLPRIQNEVQDVSNRVRSFFSDEIRVTLNNQPLRLEEPPRLINDTLMIPVRPVMESAGVEVGWHADTGAVQLDRQGNTMTLTPHSAEVHINGTPVTLPEPAQTIEGTLMAPARVLCEAMNIPFEWQPEIETLSLLVESNEERVTVSLPKGTLSLGDSLLSVQTRWGQPQRVDQSLYGFNWHVYNADYRNFFLVGYLDNRVNAIYTNSGGFVADNVAYGSTNVENTPHAYYYLDELNGNTVHAALVAETLDTSQLPHPPYDPGLVLAQELENFDCVNAFRVAHGLGTLQWNELAAETGRLHSQDMANRAYFDHVSPEGLRAWDRYEAKGGSYRLLGENIYAGHFLGIDTYHGWINSEGHREAILEPSYTTLGVGMGYTPDTEYQYYTTEIFVRV